MDDHLINEGEDDESHKRMKVDDEEFAQGGGGGRDEPPFGESSMVNDEEDQMNANLIQNAAELPLDAADPKDDDHAAGGESAGGAAASATSAGGAAAAKPKKPKKPKAKEPQNEEVVAAAKGTEKDKEFEVPLAAINKILKAALPEGAVCTKDAKSAFSKAAGIFVLYITACANDMARANKRTTITAQDITSALTELGYGSFIPHLEVTLEKMKQEAAARKNQRESTKKKPEDEAAAGGGSAATTAATSTATST